VTSQGHDILQRLITRTWYNDSVILTTADPQEVEYDLSNGAIFSDLEGPLTHFFKCTKSNGQGQMDIEYLKNSTR